ncbi:MAG: hypothetical protein Q8N03_15695 [Ignavibacteria bacterium]|nr:hypothetical protein [Ignavibacteria bacterium]
MDFAKQYIVQCIVLASNNLRLSSEKIEVVALLREAINRSKNIEQDIANMKKITELSKLGIRLHEISDYILKSKIDFLHVTDKFKEHSQSLIKEINFLLDKVTPTTFKEVLEKLHPVEVPTISLPTVDEKSKTTHVSDIVISNSKQQTENEKLKEKLIFDEDKEDDTISFHNFETTIMKPIKQLDQLLKNLADDKYTHEDLNNFAKIMTMNSEISEKFGTDIIANMHKIFAKTLIVIRNKELMPGKEVIEALRACLIVIVALVRSKEVDITVYLNRAEEFSKQLQIFNN